MFYLTAFLADDMYGVQKHCIMSYYLILFGFYSIFVFVVNSLHFLLIPLLRSLYRIFLFLKIFLSSKVCKYDTQLTIPRSAIAGCKKRRSWVLEQSSDIQRSNFLIILLLFPLLLLAYRAGIRPGQRMPARCSFLLLDSPPVWQMLTTSSSIFIDWYIWCRIILSEYSNLNRENHSLHLMFHCLNSSKL